jgi:hypothetical protein
VGKPAYVPTAAERRHPRPGTGSGYYPSYRPSGSGHRGYPGRYYGYSTYRSWGVPYWGWGYDPFYSSYGWGYDPYYSWGYDSGHGSRYGYRYRQDGDGSIRLFVEPDQTRVYVDGYYAGVADDFDGIFERLRVRPGRHEITLKLAGYRTHRMRVYAPDDDTLKLHFEMAKGAGEDPVEELADGAGRDADADADAEDDAEDDERPDWSARAERERERADEETVEVRTPARGERGGLHLSVRPEDATVYVDGAFRGQARELREMPLPPGRHRVEVVRPGYKTWEREIQVEPGRETELEVELEQPK